MAASSPVASAGLAAVAGGATWRGLTVWPPRAAVESLLRRKLARDVLFMQASNFLQKAYSFVFSVVAVRTLGLTGYGDYLTILSLYNTVNLLGSLGLGQFLVVPIAQASAAGDRKTVHEAAGYNLKLSALLAVAVAVAVLAFGPLFGRLVNRPDLGGLMRIVAISGLVAVAYNVATTALQATRRMFDLAVVENVDMVVAKVLPLGPLLLGWGLRGLLWATVVGEILSVAFALWRYRRIAVERHAFPDFGQLLAAAWRVPFGRYFRFSSIAAADKNVAQFFAQTPILFLSRWAGAEQTGLFGVAAKVFTLHSALQGAVSKVSAVRLSQEMGRNGPAATRRLFWRTTLFWGATFTLASAAFLALLPIFRWVYGPEKLPSFLLVLLFAIYTAKQGFTVSLGAIFLIANRVAVNALTKLPLIALSVPFGIWLIRDRQLGAIGAASYPLGAYLVGDLMYFAIVASPWFWRRNTHPQQPTAP